MDHIWIPVTICVAITAIVQGLKGFFERPWCTWVLNLIHLGVLIPYIPQILNVLASIAAGLALYAGDGLSGSEIWQIILTIFGFAIGSDGLYKLVHKPSGTVTK